MTTPISNIYCWEEDGKLTIDGYDYFDSMEALETDIYWQRLWIDGKAKKSIVDGSWIIC